MHKSATEHIRNLWDCDPLAISTRPLERHSWYDLEGSVETRSYRSVQCPKGELNVRALWVVHALQMLPLGPPPDQPRTRCMRPCVRATPAPVLVRLAAKSSSSVYSDWQLVAWWLDGEDERDARVTLCHLAFTIVGKRDSRGHTHTHTVDTICFLHSFQLLHSSAASSAEGAYKTVRRYKAAAAQLSQRVHARRDLTADPQL